MHPRRSFWKRWTLDFFRALDSGVSRVAIVASIVAYFGLTYANTPYAWVFIGLLGFIILGLIAWTKPPSLRPPNFAGHLDIKEINEFLADTPRVGLLGLQNVGKTTFLDATVARTSQKRQTEKPYGQFIVVPDSDPPRHVVLIDSVGGRDHVQYLVQGMAATVLFFVDHNELINTDEIDPARLGRHRHLAQQLAHTSTDQSTVVDRVIIVANKSDIWNKNQQTCQAMDQLLADVRQIFLASPSYRVVESKLPHTNDSPHDIAELLLMVV